MRANSIVGTKWAASLHASTPAVDSALPLVRQTNRAAVTDPQNLPVAARFNGNIAKVSVLAVVPLALQLWAELTDIWPLLVS